MKIFCFKSLKTSKNFFFFSEDSLFFSLMKYQLCGLFNAKGITEKILLYSGLFLWHINHCRLFNAKSSLYICIKYIWFGLVGFYGISTIAGYLIPKSSLYIYNKYIWFGSIGFYGISTIISHLISNSLYKYILNIYTLVWFYDISFTIRYLIPNCLYTYILNIYHLLWLGFMTYQPL